MQDVITPRGAAVMQQVRYETLTTLAEIDAIADDWRRLEAGCADRLTYFQSFSWCRNWIAICAGEEGDMRVRIETVRIGDELVAVWPLMTMSVRGIRIMRNLGDPHSQYGNLVYLEDRIGARELNQLVARISANPDCDVAVFQGVPETSPLANILPLGSRVAGCEDLSSVLDLSGFETSGAYVAQLGTIRRRNRKRRRNRLARLGSLDFSVIWPDDPRFADLVRECVAMKRTWLANTARYGSGFRVAGYEDFLARLSGDADALSGACVSVLKAGDTVVAIELGFLHDGHYYSYIGGFDWQHRALSPGKVQMEMTIAWLIDNGAVAYDLLGNPAEYKQSWSNREVSLNLHTLPFSWRGRFYAGTWLPLLKPAVKRAFNAAPEVLRRLIAPAQNFGLLLLYV